MPLTAPWKSLTKLFSNIFSRLAVGLALLNLVLIALAVVALHESRQNHEDRAAITTQNLAQLLDHEIAASIQRIDLALLASVAEVERQIAAGKPDPTAMTVFMEQQFLRQPDLDGLGVTDASGMISFDVGMQPGFFGNLGDRDYFLQLRASNAGLVISRPTAVGSGGRWVLGLARRINRPDNTFAGIAYGTIPLAHFVKAYSDLELGKNGTFTLFDNDLQIITRQPEPGPIGNLVGTKFGSPPLRALVGMGAPAGTYRAVSTVDGVDRMFSYRKVRDSSLNLSIGVATKDYLAEWWTEVRRTVVLVGVFIMVTLVLAWLVRRGLHRQELAVQALRESNLTLDAERNLNRTIVQSSPLAIYTRDLQGLVTGWNLAAQRLFGWREDEIIGRPLLSVPPDKRRESEELRDRVLRGENIIDLEVQRQRRDGTLFDISTTLAPTRDASGAIYGYLAIAADITERKAAEQQIEFLAYRDVLTGLPNRLLLNDRFGQAIGFADRAETRVALLFLDIDNFKTINDSLGHAVGDALLREVAVRLGACVRESDTISRQGGDEFLIVLASLADADAATPVLNKIRDQMQAPFDVNGHELATSASIGVAIYPDDGADFDTLQKKADMAMYRAKEAGRNTYRYFDPQMNVEAVELLTLKNGLARAVERNEFVLHYQPQIELAHDRVIGVEALIRWNHPELGMVPPGRFIPVAEDSGLIVPIGEWVLREACRQAQAWQDAGLAPIIMAVNLSAVQFRRGDVEQSVLAALADTGFNPRYLELELTESILIHNPESLLATVGRLKAIGVMLSIDDFGTGYSSLSYLKRFAVDKLKIDQSFIRDLATDPDDAAIVGAIIQMARSLNLRTIAEGVEDAEILARLRAIQCDEAQGYHFARPMPADELVQFLAGRKQPAQ